MELKKILKDNQQKIVLIIGYVLVAALGFQIGRISSVGLNAPGIKIQDTFGTASINDNQNTGQVQSANIDNAAGDCEGKIKGNINSKGNKIYHVPDGAFYKQTNPERCFETEAQAKSAGFVKSSR